MTPEQILVIVMLGLACFAAGIWIDQDEPEMEEYCNPWVDEYSSPEEDHW